MSAIGPKRTSLVALHMSAFGGKADMTSCVAHVCLGPKADLSLHSPEATSIGALEATELEFLN
jgi:hypothetical protein